MILSFPAPKGAHTFTLTIKFENSIETTGQRIIDESLATPLQNVEHSKFDAILDSFEPVEAVLRQISKVRIHHWVYSTRNHFTLVPQVHPISDAAWSAISSVYKVEDICDLEDRNDSHSVIGGQNSTRYR
jgi:hypothetical protein